MRSALIRDAHRLALLVSELSSEFTNKVDMLLSDKAWLPFAHIGQMPKYHFSGHNIVSEVQSLLLWYSHATLKKLRDDNQLYLNSRDISSLVLVRKDIWGLLRPLLGTASDKPSLSSNVDKNNKNVFS